MTEAPAPATRPRRGTETRKKTIPVTSRYDEREFAELDAAASQAGLTRASFQRVQSLAKPKTRSTRRPPIERELLARVLGQLGKVGSNLNQIAYAANVGEQPGLDLDDALAELRGLVPLIMEALGRDPVAAAPRPPPASAGAGPAKAAA